LTTESMNQCRQLTFCALVGLWTLSGLRASLHYLIALKVVYRVPPVFFCAICIALMACFIRPSKKTASDSESLSQSADVKANEKACSPTSPRELRSRFSDVSTVGNPSLARTLIRDQDLGRVTSPAMPPQRKQPGLFLRIPGYTPKNDQKANASDSVAFGNIASSQQNTTQQSPPVASPDIRLPLSAQISPTSTTKLLPRNVPSDISVSDRYEDDMDDDPPSPKSVYSTASPPPEAGQHHIDRSIPTRPERAITSNPVFSIPAKPRLSILTVERPMFPKPDPTLRLQQQYVPFTGARPPPSQPNYAALASTRQHVPLGIPPIQSSRYQENFAAPISGDLTGIPPALIPGRGAYRSSPSQSPSKARVTFVSPMPQAPKMGRDRGWNMPPPRKSFVPTSSKLQRGRTLGIDNGTGGLLLW
jgi:hypothetical protein